MDPSKLQAKGRDVLRLVNLPFEVDDLPDLLASHNLAFDATSLFFSALAVGALLSGQRHQAYNFFTMSTVAAERFVESPSYDLCLAYFLHHSYVVRAGTSTRARAMVAQCVQACHDLKLHHASYGVQGLHLYLLVYMADQ